MTDNNAGDGTNNNNAGGAGASGSGTDPKNTNTNASQNVVDFSKVDDDTFSKVFDDPRLFRHSRFKSLAERAKKADELETAAKQAEEQNLVEQKKFEELAKMREQERDEAISKVSSLQINTKLLSEAVKQGAIDTEAVLALIDRAKVTIDKDGNVQGAEEAVKAILEAKPFLKGKGGQANPIGSGSNPGDGTSTTPKKFKASQLNDPVFWKENEKDILAAIKSGQVEMDIQV